MKSFFSRRSVLLGCLFGSATVLMRGRQSQAGDASLPLAIAHRLVNGTFENMGLKTCILPDRLPDNLPLELPMPKRSHLLGTVLQFDDAFIYAESELTAPQIQQFYAEFFTKIGWQVQEKLTYHQKGQPYQITLSIVPQSPNQQQRQVFSLDLATHPADEPAEEQWDAETWQQSIHKTFTNHLKDWLSVVRYRLSPDIPLPPAQLIPQTLVVGGSGGGGGIYWHENLSILSRLSAAEIMSQIDRQFQSANWQAGTSEQTAHTAMQRWQQHNRLDNSWDCFICIVEANELSRELPLAFLGGDPRFEPFIQEAKYYAGWITIQEQRVNRSPRIPANYQPPRAIDPRFAQVILGDYHQGNLPPQAQNMPMPPQAQVVASMTKGEFSNVHEGMIEPTTIVLDVPLSPQQTQEFYDRALTEKGWKPDRASYINRSELPYGFPGLIWPIFYHSGNQRIQLLILPTSRSQQSDVRLLIGKQDPEIFKQLPIESINLPSKPVSLSQLAAEAVSPEYKPPILPLVQFVLPDSIAMMGMGSGGSSEDNFAQEVTLESQLSLKALSDVFGTQMAHRGWQQTLSESSATILLSRWQLQDQQSTWQTNLIYMQQQPGEYQVSLRCDRLAQ
jgi:hypothetical protein